MRPLDLDKRCPVDMAIEVVGGKWKPLILHRLGAGPHRFNELQRAVQGVTQRMLTLQLRELERDGLVVRTVHAQVPLRVEYRLAPVAHTLLPVLESLGRWLLAHHHALRPAAQPLRRRADDAALVAVLQDAPRAAADHRALRAADLPRRTLPGDSP